MERIFGADTFKRFDRIDDSKWNLLHQKCKKKLIELQNYCTTGKSVQILQS